jgi:proteic killer suppression protein
MKIEFRDRRLALIRTDRAAETKLPFAVIKACCEKLVVLEAAPDERTLKNWRSLHLKTVYGDESSHRLVQVSDQWSMAFTIDESSVPPTITILAIEEPH